MGDKRGDQTHIGLLKETGKFEFSKEQQDVMDRIMGDTTFDLMDDIESTLELPAVPYNRTR